MENSTPNIDLPMSNMEAIFFGSRRLTVGAFNIARTVKCIGADRLTGSLLTVNWSSHHHTDIPHTPHRTHDDWWWMMYALRTPRVIPERVFGRYSSLSHLWSIIYPFEMLSFVFRLLSFVFCLLSFVFCLLSFVFPPSTLCALRSAVSNFEDHLESGQANN